MAITQKEVTKTIQLDLSKIPTANREIAKEEAATVIIDEINKYLERSESPIDGGEFKKKKIDGENSILFDTGEMRNAIEWKSTRNGIKVGIFDSDEAAKAHGHHKDTRGILPPRQFIPEPDQAFKKDINAKVVEVLKQFEESKETRRSQKRETVDDLIIRFIK